MPDSVGTGYGNVVTLSTANDTTKVRFTYNGQEVIYGVIKSSASGKNGWTGILERNKRQRLWMIIRLISDLFQWGALLMMHQLINWTSSSVGTPVIERHQHLPHPDNPGHNNFILAPYDDTEQQLRLA